MNRNNSKIGKIFILLITIASIQCCAVFSSSGEQKKQQKETDINGIIIGSLTFPKEKARYDIYSIRVTGKYTDKNILKEYTTDIRFYPEQTLRMRHIGDLDNGLTYLYTMKIPEGKYEIPYVSLFRNSGIRALQRSVFADGFSIPFEVKKGEIIYIGNIFLNEYAKKNDTIVSFRNNYEKDIDAIMSILPGIDWSNTINDINRKIEYKNEDK